MPMYLLIMKTSNFDSWRMGPLKVGKISIVLYLILKVKVEKKQSLVKLIILLPSPYQSGG